MGDRFCVFVLILAGLLSAGAARADDDADSYNRVTFGVESSREVENDRATAMIGATHEDADAATVAARINEDMQWGLALAKAEKAVDVRTGGYRTYPISDSKQNRLRRWRGSQEMLLESDDPEALAQLLGRLQEKLQLNSFRFSVSREKRAAVEGEIIEQALAAFRVRADRVRKQLGAKDYELVSVHIDTGGRISPRLQMEAMPMASSKVSRPPALEGGASTLTANVRGTIELSF